MAGPDYVTQQALLDDPGFDRADRVHDWRNHVGENVRRLWPSLTAEVRIAIALDAMDMSGEEIWD